MKYVWEATDIRVGRRVWTGNGSEQYIIGYDPSTPGPHNLNLVSLSDGMMARHSHGKEDMAKHLNDSDMVPEQVEK